MNEQQAMRDVIRANISGPVSGQVAVGNDIHQTQTIGAAGSEVTQAELMELRQAFVDLKTYIEANVPSDKKVAALEHAAELEDAITAGEPDLGAIGYVRRWFARHLPELVGAVTSVVVHPIVGKLVEAAGEGLASEFRRRFGGE